MSERDLTEGSLFKHLISLALPAAVAMLLQSSYGLIDIYWVGKLGSSPVAAISLVWILFSFVLAVAHSLGTGTVALVAQYYGEREYLKAETISRESLLLSLFTASILSVLGFLFSHRIIHVLGGREEVLLLGTEYFRIISIAYFFQLLTFNINFSLRGRGDMTTPMVILLIASLLNIILDPLLIFGVGFFPRLEIRGAALSTLISHIVAFLYALRVLQIRGTLKFSEMKFKLNSSLVKTLLMIGIPVGLQFGMMGGVRMIVLRFSADYGTEILAAAGIGFRILLMAILPVVAIGTAATTLVGQNLGAKKVSRSEQGGLHALLLAMGLMAILATLIALLAEPLMGFFSKERVVIETGVSFLRIASLSLLFIGFAIAANGVFRGAGNTTPPMIISILKLLILIPLSIFLPKWFQLGVKGLWWAIVIVYVLEAVLNGVWFFIGKWKIRRVEEFESPLFSLPTES